MDIVASVLAQELPSDILPIIAWYHDGLKKCLGYTFTPEDLRHLFGQVNAFGVTELHDHRGVDVRCYRFLPPGPGVTRDSRHFACKIVAIRSMGGSFVQCPTTSFRTESDFLFTEPGHAFSLRINEPRTGGASLNLLDFRSMFILVNKRLQDLAIENHVSITKRVVFEFLDNVCEHLRDEQISLQLYLFSCASNLGMNIRVKIGNLQGAQQDRTGKLAEENTRLLIEIKDVIIRWIEGYWKVE